MLSFLWSGHLGSVRDISRKVIVFDWILWGLAYCFGVSMTSYHVVWVGPYGDLYVNMKQCMTTYSRRVPLLRLTVFPSSEKKKN